MKRALFLILLLFLTSCTTQELSQTQEITDKPLIGLSMGGYLTERWTTDKNLLEQYAKENGADMIVRSANNDAEIQKSDIESLILQGVDVLIIVPQVADSLINQTQEAKDTGIKIISYDRLITKSNIDLYISFDNEEVGRLQAQAVVNKAKPGKLVYVGGSLDDNNALLLKKGTMQVLQPYLDNGTYELVYEKFTEGWAGDVAYQNLKEFLKNETNITGVIAANDGTAAGAIQALEEVGLKGKIPVSGQDAELTACQRIVHDFQTGTVYKPINKLAKETINIAVKMAKNETYQIDTTIDNNLLQVPARLLNPTLVTKENIDETVIFDGFHTRSEVYEE